MKSRKSNFSDGAGVGGGHGYVHSKVMLTELFKCLQTLIVERLEEICKKGHDVS